jgi:hypothetical protein
MAAGLGFKTFTTGEVLTAADTNGYLMQGVLVFADAAARTAAITSPQEGQMSYLKDTNSVESYSGSAWVAVGGNSPLTTKGDLYTYSTTNARLGVGADYSFLTALASETTGQLWSSSWTSWTPTTSGATIGNGTITAKYQRIGKTCIARFDFLLGSTSSVTSDFYFSLPFSPASSTRVTGFGMMFASVGVVPAVPEISGSNMYLRASSANSTYVVGVTTSSTVPGSWTTNNWLAATSVYEVA